MKKYIVTFFLKGTANVEVAANSKEEAGEKAWSADVILNEWYCDEIENIEVVKEQSNEDTSV